MEGTGLFFCRDDMLGGDKHSQVSKFDKVQALLSSPCELGLRDMVGLSLGRTHLSKLKDSKM